MDKRIATLVVARRLEDQRSGDNVYLATYLDLCRAAGLTTRLVFAPQRSFGNKAWARLAPDIRAGVAEVDWAQAIRFGDIYVSVSLKVWVRFAMRVLSELRRRSSGGAAHPYPSLLGYELSPKEARRTMSRIRARKTNIVTAEYSSLAPLLRGMGGTFRVVLLHDLFSLRAESFSLGGLRPDHAAPSLGQEADRCSAADLLIHASCVERDRLLPLLPNAAHIWMAPQPVVHSLPRATKGMRRAVFLGSRHAGNALALRYLRDKIWPHVRHRMPQARLVIVGKIAETVSPAEARAEGLDLRGPVKDLSDLSGGPYIGLAPMTFGSGIPIKVVDYLSMGMPVVVTQDTMKAFGGALDDMVIVTQNDEAFGESICKLLQSDTYGGQSCSKTSDLARRLDNALVVEALKKGGHRESD